MFKRNYNMTRIRDMLKMALKITCNIDEESPSIESLEDEQDKSILGSLIKSVNEGNINEAENELFNSIKPENKNYLRIALLFYSYLNEKDDNFLEENDFGRDEIKTGLKDVMSAYGLESLSEALF